MQSDTIKLIVTYLTAALLAIGSLIAAVWAWAQPVTEPPRDLSILYGVLGLVIGATISFLFGQESATRAARSTERAAGLGPMAFPPAFEDPIPDEDFDGPGDVGDEPAAPLANARRDT